MEEAGKRTPHVAPLTGYTEGGSYLPQHLVFPHYHGVQAAGDTKEVPGAVLVPVLV
jgi:hypothetical protein